MAYMAKGFNSIFYSHSHAGQLDEKTIIYRFDHTENNIWLNDKPEHQSKRVILKVRYSGGSVMLSQAKERRSPCFSPLLAQSDRTNFPVHAENKAFPQNGAASTVLHYENSVFKSDVQCKFYPTRIVSPLTGAPLSVFIVVSPPSLVGKKKPVKILFIFFQKQLSFFPLPY